MASPLAVSLSTTSLVAVLAVFTVVGAMLFVCLEAPAEKSAQLQLLRARNDTLKAIWKSAAKAKSFEKWERKASKHLIAYRDQVQAGFAQGVESPDAPAKWTLPGALFYCVTVYTTIGYGNLAPVTWAGRLMTCVYALIGIPLCLVVLARLGIVMTKSLKAAHGKFVRKQETPLIECYSSASESFDFPLTTSLFIMLLFMLFGALLYRLWEHWTFTEALYFVFISLSTIGFGDVLPDSQPHFLLSSIYLLLGLSLVSMVINLITEALDLHLVKGGQQDSPEKKTQ